MNDARVVIAGRYRLESQIAAGGIGEVWRARDLVLDRPVAVKVLRSEYAGQPEALARFRAEGRKAGSVSHPGIAQIYDYGEAGPGGAPYLVMELVNGPSLAEVLAAGPLDAASAMDVLAQAAVGLHAAHAVGLVHRDIKPANLVLGPGGRLKITDFGIAHAAGSVPITRTGALIGTPAYLAPEQVAGDPASPASDLYALGVVGYECLTGSAPFRGAPVEVAAAHQHRPLPPLPPAVPAAAASLVADLTVKDPAARPRDAAEVAARASELRDALTGGADTALAEIASARARSRGPAPHPVTLVDSHVPTWHDSQLPPWSDAPRQARPGAYPWPPARPRTRRRPWPADRLRRHGLVAAAGIVLFAALGAWLLVATLPGLPGSHQPAAPASHPASSPVVHTVQVNDAAFVGQPVSQVTQSLLQLGLTPAVSWTPSGQDPGTVMSVQPSGAVPAGSTVTVTAAYPAPDGHHHHHDGSGGGDNGD
jgi:eukaryotic-like serine/threonine-protein kinase